MDVDLLRYFQQVADGVTVTEVAEWYQVSQSGVSRGLRRLEEEVGADLLVRSGRILRLTHAGHAFQSHVDAALHSLDDGLAAMEQLIEPETGTVRLSFQQSLGTWFVPRLIAAFRQQHDQVQFQLGHSRDADDSSLVREGEVDLELTARRSRDPDVHWQRLFVQPLCLAVPPGHRLVGRGEVHLAEAADDDFIVLTSGWILRDLSEELCHDAGFSPRVAFQGNDLSLVLGFVSAGLGVAIVPDDRDDHDPSRDSLLLSLADTGAFREVGLAWSTRRRLLPSAELFRRHVLHYSARFSSLGRHGR